MFSEGRGCAPIPEYSRKEASGRERCMLAQPAWGTLLAHHQLGVYARQCPHWLYIV